MNRIKAVSHSKPVIPRSGEPDVSQAIVSHSLLKTLESDFISQWEAFRKTQPMEAANRFGEDLEKLGLKYGVNSLAVYGERLVSHVNNFDIENMRSTLHTFPEIINRMKKEV